MIQYTLLDPVTGYRWTVSDFRLTRNLRLNTVLLRGDEHLGIITRRDQVVFARWCVGEILARLKGEPDRRVAHALSLVDRWLEDESCVTPEELEVARSAVYDVWGIANVPRSVPRVAELTDIVVWTTIMPNARVGAARAAEVTATTPEINSYEAQARWFVQHLQSGK